MTARMLSPGQSGWRRRTRFRPISFFETKEPRPTWAVSSFSSLSRASAATTTGWLTPYSPISWRTVGKGAPSSISAIRLRSSRVRRSVLLPVRLMILPFG